MLGLGVFSQVSVFLKSLPLPVQNTPQKPKLRTVSGEETFLKCFHVDRAKYTSETTNCTGDISIRTRGVIGQVCVPYFFVHVVRPFKFESFPFPRARLTSEI